MEKHIIDLSANAVLPKEWKAEDCWKIEKHHKGEADFEWDPTKVSLHLSPNQQSKKYFGGTELHKELESVPVYNANLLDWLLAHPEFIPDSWKGKYVFFWGTIYRGPRGLYVRYLFFLGGYWHWTWDSRWLDCGFYAHSPAAVSAS